MDNGSVFIVPALFPVYSLEVITACNLFSFMQTFVLIQIHMGVCMNMYIPFLHKNEFCCTYCSVLVFFTYYIVLCTYFCASMYGCPSFFNGCPSFFNGCPQFYCVKLE